ncbi:MAG: hypothetical protein U0228_36375 [Myxococcaceae bacterium]
MKAALLALFLAYVMPPYGVLKRMANQRDEINTAGFKAEGVAQVSPVLAKDVSAMLGITWNSGDLTLNASLAVKFPGRCHLELSSPESTRVLSATWVNGKKKVEGGDLPALGVMLEQACALLSPRSTEEGATREGYSKHLGALKVDAKNFSLARFNGSVSYLIGQKGDAQPQLWVYKDVFLPSRVRWADESGTWWDVHLGDYGSQATGELWPRVLEVEKGSEPQLRVMILTADPRADLSGVKF